MSIVINYLNAEFYKAFRRKYLYLFLAAILGLLSAFMLLLRVEGMRATVDGMIQQVTVSELLGILSMSLQTGLYFLMIAVDIVFSEQYKHNTLKNEVSYGLSRVRIYLGKLISSVLVAVVLCAVLIAGYMGISLLLFPVRDEMLGDSLRTFGLWLGVAFPLWLGGLGAYTLLQFTMKSTAATIVYVMVVGFLGSGFLDLFTAFLPSLTPMADAIRTISLNTPFTLMRRSSPEELLGYAWILGLAWLGITTGAGLMSFRRREIS